MGGVYLMHKFFKIDLLSYNNLQLEINNALYDKYIATQMGTCVLDPIPQLTINNYVYFPFPEYIYNDPLIENYINQLIEITEDEYRQAIENITLL